MHFLYICSPLRPVCWVVPQPLESCIHVPCLVVIVVHREASRRTAILTHLKWKSSDANFKGNSYYFVTKNYLAICPPAKPTTIFVLQVPSRICSLFSILHARSVLQEKNDQCFQNLFYLFIAKNKDNSKHMSVFVLVAVVSVFTSYDTILVVNVWIV